MPYSPTIFIMYIFPSADNTSIYCLKLLSVVRTDDSWFNCASQLQLKSLIQLQFIHFYYFNVITMTRLGNLLTWGMAAVKCFISFLKHM